MNKGDIVLIPFPFTDLIGNRNRPALILIGSEDDITVSFITTQFKWQTDYDVIIQPSKDNGLKKTSLIRLNKFATIDKDLVIGKLGSLDSSDMLLINENLKKILKLL